MTAKWLERAKREGVGILPPIAEKALMAASQVGEPGSRERIRAIDRAYERTSSIYPSLFRG